MRTNGRKKRNKTKTEQNWKEEFDDDAELLQCVKSTRIVNTIVI